MSFIELDRDEYLYSVKRIGDYDTLKFSKQSLDWWDDYFSWEKFPPMAISLGGINKAYLFYSVSKDKRYLTIHRLFTPKAFRQQGFANKLLAELFNIKSDTNIDRFKILCVSSSLAFYNSIGLSYWGVNSLNQYYCDFKMPKDNMCEIAQIVKESSTDEFTQIEYDNIYEKLKDNGSEFDVKQTGIHQSSMEMLGDKYMHDDFLKQQLNVTKL
jgi:hypothetical protein